jgi:hypothetical protein
MSIKHACYTLGIFGIYTRDDVIKAFRKWALLMHPDHGGNAETFRRLVAARDLLLLSLERAHLHPVPPAPPAPPPPPPPPPAPSSPPVRWYHLPPLSRWEVTYVVVVWGGVAFWITWVWGIATPHVG